MVHFSVSASLIWAIFVVFYGLRALYGDDPISLNELGDWFAGAFSPLAFAWLVWGFFLQRDELSQNTKILELQRVEMAESAEAARNQVLAEISRNRPMLVVRSIRCSAALGGKVILKLEVFNIGAFVAFPFLARWSEDGDRYASGGLSRIEAHDVLIAPGDDHELSLLGAHFVRDDWTHLRVEVSYCEPEKIHEKKVRLEATPEDYLLAVTLSRTNPSATEVKAESQGRTWNPELVFDNRLGLPLARITSPDFSSEAE
jgi:hypothetical protein